MKNVLFVLLSCSLVLSQPLVKAHGRFTAVGNVAKPRLLYTPSVTRTYRVSIYVEDETRAASGFADYFPIVSYTSPYGATAVGLPFGPQAPNSWTGSDTFIVHSVSGSGIYFTSTEVPVNTDKIEYIWVIESL